MCTIGIRNIFVYTVHGTQCNMYIHPGESMTARVMLDVTYTTT
jgi:hypothetical protein